MFGIRNSKFAALSVFVVALMVGAVAHADTDLTLGLDRITNNSSTGDAIGDQLSIEVLDAAPQLQFLLSNIGPAESIIVRFYWTDAPAYLDFSTFEVPAGWEAISSGDFVGARTLIPRAINGLGPGESASFFIDYAAGANFASFLGALQTGELELRLHVRDIEGNLRETYRAYVSDDNVIAPAPAPLALALVGMACVAVARRRSRSQSKS